MAKKSTVQKARSERRRGKAPSTQAGEFIKEEIEEVRSGKHGVANAKQAIAIGLAKARKAGVKVGANPRQKSKEKKKTSAGRRKSGETSAKRSRASLEALKKKPLAGASHRALSMQAKAAVRRRKKK